MINKIFFLYCLTACSEYQLTEKKNIDDDIDEIIVNTTDTATSQVDTGTEETGDNQVNESSPVAVCSVTPNPYHHRYAAKIFGLRCFGSIPVMIWICIY